MEFETVIYFQAPCGCAVHFALEETRVPGFSASEQFFDTHLPIKERPTRYVTYKEAEKIRMKKFLDPFWGKYTNPNPNPFPVHCRYHAHLGHTWTWYETLKWGG